MNIELELEQIRSYWLRVQHLDEKLPATGLLAAAGVCGLQNSPPGAWETALFNRLEGITLRELQEALYEKKSLLQAWSFRGAPVVFPTEQREVFLTTLIAREGEQPWIYTLGISGALEFLQMSFDDLLERTKDAAKYLDSHTIKSKELLDRTLAEIILKDLPREKRELWCAPSMYGSPDKQTMGDAAVSFLLRPCSFSSLVVFGERQGISPTFTSLQNWIGRTQENSPNHELINAPLASPYNARNQALINVSLNEPSCAAEEVLDRVSEGLLDRGADGGNARKAEKELVRKFLHCYGPATMESFMSWLGSSRKQARRLWNAVDAEREPVTVCGKTAYILSADREALLSAETCGERLLLLGAHDPYLDSKDRFILLEEKALQKKVWKTVGNPGAILKGGRVAGIWKTKTQKDKLDVSVSLFEAFESTEREKLKDLAEEFAAFRQLSLKSCQISSEG